MLSDKLIYQLQKYFLNAQLPGIYSHIKMAPLPDRLTESHAPDTTIAAVMILLFHENQEWYFPLIQRPAHNNRDPHKGQISLPGGRNEPDDQSLEQTAIRETFEEIGVLYKNIQILGKLSSLYIPVSKNLVHPYIGFVDRPPTFIRHAEEVDEIWSCPLSSLINQSTRSFRNLKTSYAEDIRVPGMEINNRWIWGATAMILEEFSDVLQNSIIRLE